MARNVVFAAPFPADITMRFVRAAARLHDVRLLGIVHTPPSGEDAHVFHDFVRVTEPLSVTDLRALLAYEEAAKARAPFQTLLANRITRATAK
jgi:hypothetical protein